VNENRPLRTEPFSTIQRPKSRVSLAAARSSAARSGCIPASADFRPARKARPAFVGAELDALAERLRTAGYECRDDDEFKDYRRMFIFDPFGNRSELLQPRAAPG